MGSGRLVHAAPGECGTVLDALATAIDRLITFVTEHQGDRPLADLYELLALDQEVAALCQVTGLTLPASTLEGYYANDSVGFCQIPVSQHFEGVRIGLDHGWVIALQGLRRVAELTQAQKRRGASPKRGARGANIEVLTQEMAEHLCAARDHAFATQEQ